MAPSGNPYTKPESVTKNVKPSNGGVDTSTMTAVRMTAPYGDDRISKATFWITFVVVKWLVRMTLRTHTEKK